MARKIKIYGERFWDFYYKQNEKVQNKIDYVLNLVRQQERLPKNIFKCLADTDGIYEVRVITHIANIRILCFYDDGNIIVLTNCFTKKQQKTPQSVIRLAQRLKKEYFSEKQRG